MPVRSIVLLGDPRLYQPSEAVRFEELDALRPVVIDLNDTMLAFRAEHGWGRAIAAPQIGVHKRIVCMDVDGPRVLFNPVIDQKSAEMLQHWEDCMSLPELLVRLENPKSCRVTYRDETWCERQAWLDHDMAELIQHEVDHLDGVLSVQRAIDERSIVLRRAVSYKSSEFHGTFRLLDAAAPVA